MSDVVGPGPDGFIVGPGGALVGPETAPTLADLLAWPVRETITVAELEPTWTLEGFALASGQTVTYAIACPAFEAFVHGWRGGLYRPVVGVRENGVELEARTSIVDVEAAAGTYFWDEAAEVLYVHSTTDAAPDTFDAYEAVVRFHVATTGIVLNRGDDPDRGVYYWPMITGQAPTKHDRMATELFGIASTTGGQLQLTNGHAFWHRVLAPEGLYNWNNKRARVRTGGRFRGISLSDGAYEPFATMRIQDPVCDDEVATFRLVSLLKRTDVLVPRTPLFPGDWPNLDPADRGKDIPIGYGRQVRVPLLADNTPDAWVYLLADPAYQTLYAVHGVSVVARSDGSITGLSTPADYDVDLTGCTVTVTNPAYPPADFTVLVDVTGKPTAGAPLLTFAAIVRDLLETFCDFKAADFDEASFTQAAIDAPEVLSVWLDSGRTLASILSATERDQPSLEKSVLGIVRYTPDGRCNVKIRSALQTSGSVSLQTSDFVRFKQERVGDPVFSSTTVFYGRERGAWQNVTTTDQGVRYRLDTTETAKLYTFLTDEGDADTLAQRYQLMAGGPRLQFSFIERSARLYRSIVADVARVSFSPAPTPAGMLEDDSLEIVELEGSVTPVVEVRGALRDIRGLGNRGWSWADDAEPDTWALCSAIQRSLFGFWADDATGRIDPLDPTTADLKVWP